MIYEMEPSRVLTGVTVQVVMDIVVVPVFVVTVSVGKSTQTRLESEMYYNDIDAAAVTPPAG